MDFVDAQGAGELGQRPGAVVGVVQLLELPVQAVVDEPRGQLQEKVTPEGRLNPFQTHMVFQQAIQYRLADRVGILRLGLDAGNLGPKRATTGAAGPVLGGDDVNEQDALVRDAADGPVELFLAAAQAAAVRTRSLFRGLLPVLMNHPGSDGFHACLSCKGLLVKNLYSGAGLTPLATGIYRFSKVSQLSGWARSVAIFELVGARPLRGHPVAAYHSDQLSELAFKLLATKSLRRGHKNATPAKAAI